MSYLDPPRVYFAGVFTATPSTINNAIENYPLGTQYNNAPPGPVNPTSVWWNPLGWHFFTIPQAQVTGACQEIGTNITTGDSVIGASIVSIATGAAPMHQARLVDLDPDQQSRSMIVGLALQISTSDGVTITGVVAPMTIIDIWGRVQGGSGGGINTAGCMYQSVMQNLTWTGIESTSSKVLQALYAASPNALSIKFNVDAYNGLGPSNPDFTKGRIVGTIGPYGTLSSGIDEPMHVVAQRRAYAGGANVMQQSPLNPAPFQANNGWLSIDLGNSIPTQPSTENPQLAGAFLDLGPVTLIIQGQSSSFVTLYSGDFGPYYDTTSGIFDVQLSSSQQSTLGSAPLGVQIDPGGSTGPVQTAAEVKLSKEGGVVAVSGSATTTNAPTIALAENANGVFASLDFNALRMANDSPAWSNGSLSGTEITSNAEVPLYVTFWGTPANASINFYTTFNQYQFQNSQGNLYFINNAPASAITPAPSSDTPPAGNPPVIATVSTSGGYGTFSVTANALSQQGVDGVQNGRRSALTSQLYLYTHDSNMDTIGQPLTVLVFVNACANASSPTWTTDVQPILAQYAQLYPGMKSILDIGDYNTVKGSANAIKAVLNLAMTDPGLMPVTRDLSPANLAMINTWFANGCPQ